MTKFLLFFTLLLSSNAQAFTVKPIKPTSYKTPGSLCDRQDPHYTHDRYPEKISYCKRRVSTHLKRKIYNQYKVNIKYKEHYTIDHFIPLALGGDNSPANLWPEHKKIKALRPDLELQLYIKLKNGLITQHQAIRAIIEAKMNPPLHKLDREAQEQMKETIQRRKAPQPPKPYKSISESEAYSTQLMQQKEIEEFLGTFED